MPVMLQRSLMFFSSFAVVERTVTGRRGKLKSPVVKQKSVALNRKGGNLFPSQREKGTNGLSFFALEGKIEKRIRISARKRACGSGLSKQLCPAMASSIKSWDKHLNPPPPPPTPHLPYKKIHEIGQMDNRNQARYK